MASTATSDTVMLSVRDLVVRYGAIQAVRGIGLDIAQGEIVALIGANGAGKTTVARAIAGVLPYRGEIIFEGEALKPNNAERNLARGIALVPEGRGILGTMTVQDNLLMGLYIRRDKAQAQKDLAALLERFRSCAERRHLLASLMSGGEQQMLAIARALLSKPKLLLLDEPSLGPRAEADRLVFAHEFGASPRRADRAAGRAEGAPDTQDRGPRLSLGDRPRDYRGAAKELIDDPVVSETFLGGRAAAVTGHAG